MKAILFVILLLISMKAICQETTKLSLPKPVEVARIELSSVSSKAWYKPVDLLKNLPNFVAIAETYGTKLPFQHGKFVLKNRKEIRWMAAGSNSILVYQQTKTGRMEQLFILKKDEPLFIIFDKDGKEGFINADGKTVIPTKFDKVTEFIEDLAAVKFNGKWGFINRQGNFVVEPKYEGITPFSEGLAAVSLNHKWGFIDSKGNFKIKPKWTNKERDYSYLNYSTGPGFVKNGYKFKDGIANVYEEVRATGESYDPDLFKCGYINKAGEYLIEPVWRSACGDFHEGLAMTGVDPESPDYKRDSGWIGYINLKGNWTITPQFYEGGDFKNGYALVKLPTNNYENEPRLFENKDWILVDKKGQKAVGIKNCERQFQFHEGFAQAYTIIDTTKFQHFFINEKCEKAIILPNNTSIESDFSDGLALVYKLIPKGEGVNPEKIYGYLDNTGKMVIPFQFKEAEPFSDGFAVIRKEDGNEDIYVNKKGEEVFEKSWKGASSFRNGLADQFLALITISEGHGIRNPRGYMNTHGKYVWVSPNTKNYLGEEWMKKHYIGTQKFD
jgi:hypothetical protein